MRVALPGVVLRVGAPDPERKKEMKHLDKALIASGAALLLSGGIAAAALGPRDIANLTPAAVMASLSGDVTLAVQGNNARTGGKNLVATAATYIGITEAALRTELASGKSLADVAVANGKTRDGLIAALTAAATTQITTLVDTKNPGFGGPGPGGRGGGPGGLGGMRGGDDITAAATYLGTTDTDLHNKLQAGQTLAQIAAATSGKSRDGLIQALVAHETTEIDAAQTAGKITADQAAQAKANLTTRITQMVDSTRPAGGPGFGGPGRGRR